MFTRSFALTSAMALLLAPPPGRAPTHDGLRSAAHGAAAAERRVAEAGERAPARGSAALTDGTSGPPLIEVRLTGRIVSDGTPQPVGGAMVTVVGTGHGALSNADGRYTVVLGDTFVGREVRVEVNRIGFAIATRTVSLTPGINTEDFVLQTMALGLDEVATTGAGPRAGRVAYRSLALQESRHAVGDHPLPKDREGYAHIAENPFVAVADEPLSTFSIDVDRASYANVRRFIREGRRPPTDAVRIEELVNYFPYADPAPDGKDPFSVTAEIAPAPWQPLHRLVRIGLKGREIDMDRTAPNNLVFLLDVSGSMRSPDKLPLLKKAFTMLAGQLRPEDRVAIVVYAGAAGLVLPSTPGSDRAAILESIQALEAGGSTAGGAGIRLAYQVAADNHIEGGNNRVILATDGDFNVGASSDSEMIRLIEEKREQGTFLTVLGFGTGNLQDAKMEQIADHGNGNFAYIDSELEAKKVLVQEMGGTLVTIAKDVKIQVEFNPSRVAAYRLIGYENRLLAAEDFNDDTRDAGELGAGHSVTALYEIVPTDVESPAVIRDVDPLRYQRDPPPVRESGSGEILFVKLRYKDPDGSESRLLTRAVEDATTRSSADFRFAAAVAAWGMLLRDSEHIGDFSLDDVAALAQGAMGSDRDGYRADFIGLVERARSLELLSVKGDSR